MIIRLKNLLLLSMTALFCISTAQQDANDAFGKSFFQPRSQGQYRPPMLIGQSDRMSACEECFNGTLFAVLRYQSNFDREEIGKYLFFNGTSSMLFKGRDISGTRDVRADQFLLSDNFENSISIEPSVQSFIGDVDFYFNLDEWVCGLWFSARIPVTYTKWDINFTSTAAQTPDNITGANRLGNPMAEPALYNQIVDAWNGGQVNTDRFPFVKEPLNFARVDGSQTKTSVAELRLNIGYNFICNECAHFGASARFAAPTGTRPNGEFLFEPVVGNGHHVQFGAGLHGHVDLWSNDCDQNFSFWADGLIYHLFRAQQKRTFDFTQNGIGSRYVLLKKFNDDQTITTEITRGPNVLTLDTKVDVDVMGEATFMFDYQKCGFDLFVGYNLWGRTKENVNITGTIEPMRYGIAGDAVSNNVSTNSLFEIDGTNGAAVPGGIFTGEPNPVFISVDQLNPFSAAGPSALSHMIFAHLNWTWEECDYLPFLGIGSFAEFSGKGNRALDNWGIWVLGGFSFL